MPKDKIVDSATTEKKNQKKVINIYALANRSLREEFYKGIEIKIANNKNNIIVGNFNATKNN
ncbi:hypothetical protein BB561_006296 [Smittium simulii]|uniref:Uncharacterized protein n=1 Tax=Smittium simulii TaxID=133385 RepID=A0A2T9Y5C6_9FUNG|nr:hypothetical protein BB561_006296 [Smittium simulii]